MRVTIGSFQKCSCMLITSVVWQLDAMLDQLSSFSSCKFYQSCNSSSGLLNLCLYNFGKECPKVQWFFFNFLFSSEHCHQTVPYPPLDEAACSQRSLHSASNEGSLMFPFSTVLNHLDPKCFCNSLETSFITWDSICISWHPNLVFVITNVNLSFFTKVCITSFSFPESENWFWFFLTLPFHFFAFFLVDLSSWSQISKCHKALASG